MIQWDGGRRNNFCLTDSLQMIQADTLSLGNPENLFHCPFHNVYKKLVCSLIMQLSGFLFFFPCNIIIKDYSKALLKLLIFHRFKYFSFNIFTRFTLRKTQNKRVLFSSPHQVPQALSFPLRSNQHYQLKKKNYKEEKLVTEFISWFHGY